MKFFAFVLVILVIHLGTQSPASAISRSTKAQAIEKKVNLLTLEERVGQLFLFGFTGRQINEGLAARIRDYRPGGILVFGRNIRSARQISRLLYYAQRYSQRLNGVPLFVAVDQEGGDVTRIKTSPPMPSALAMAESQRPDLVEKVGFHTGKLLNKLGFNMNLAPVVDLADPNVRTFVGTRSFGTDPKRVSELSRIFSKGMQKAGVLATAKHYPGHGPLITDSHKKTPMSFQTLGSLMERDLFPYYALSKDQHVDAVMLAHVSFPKIDPSEVPATFSPILVQRTLREQLGFDGVIVTDDLEMSGANVFPNVGTRAVKALQAGADMLMFAWNPRAQKKAFRAVLKAVRAGQISESRINASVRRILSAKSRISPKLSNLRPSSRQIHKALKNKSFAKIIDEIFVINFRRAVSLFKRKNSANLNSFPILAFSASRSFLRSLKANLRSGSTKTYRLSSKRKRRTLESALRRHSTSPAIYHVTGRQTARTLNRFPKSLRKRILVYNTQFPGLVKNSKDFMGVINTYSRHPASARMLAQTFLRFALKTKKSSETAKEKHLAAVSK